jgi:hypothetical protein
MAKTTDQNRENHGRIDPPFHYFILPVLVISWIVSSVAAARHPNFTHIWVVVFVTAAIVWAFKTRLYALRVQDRVIRLEERLRLMTLLPEIQRPQIARLREGQLIALRFASDEEVPALMERTLADNLKGAEIKKTIKSWRADYWRV